MTDKELHTEFGILLYHIHCLPYEEAWTLEPELKEAYKQYVDSRQAYESLAQKIKTRQKQFD